ncbi:hypothetical protein [Spartinivicinus poritis]|uniref:Lipoprotein n=1 Tax=Spartinivicinus poritis TaxID=2994640 RepID=A0ABT5UFA2_9GAMM|nr:hypothetical protein [Spartinivicinus sp. A2-2]MDE1464187.1 hypothetical protein [Spartinivicinus sp. A2-2]
MKKFALKAVSQQILIGITALVMGCQVTTPVQKQSPIGSQTTQAKAVSKSVAVQTKLSAIQAEPDYRVAKVQQKTDQLANKIKRLIETGNLTKPVSNSALTTLHQLEREKPDHPELSSLKQTLASRLMRVAYHEYSQNNQAKALYYANVAQQVLPDIAGGEELVTQIRQQVKAQVAAAVRNNKTTGRVTIIQPAVEGDDSLIAKTLFESLSDEQRKVLAELPQDINSVLLNIIILNQNEVQDRLFDVRYVLDSIVDQMVKENARAVVTTRSMKDSRWLAALLKTRIRQVNPYFELHLLKRVNKELKPHIALYAQ